MNALVFLSLLGVACAQFYHGPVPIQYGAAPFPFNHAVAPFPYVYNHANVVPITYSAIHPATPVVNQVAQPIIKTAVTPAVIPGPNVFHKFHNQGADGTYEFGYSGGPSSRHETKDVFGIVRGAFNYIDPVGDVQSQQYVADGLGFRVAGTNLPVATNEPVKETFEVASARAAHENAKIRNKRSANSHKKTVQFPASTSPLIKTFTPSVYPTVYSSNTPYVYPTVYNTGTPFVYPTTYNAFHTPYNYGNADFIPPYYNVPTTRFTQTFNNPRNSFSYVTTH